jgi:2-polyprenyl-3-methyl-5-hydroxy-6-metoxy-1,4-benzoquinol methylase
MKCRHCDTEINTTFVNLGTSPPSNALLKKCDLKSPENWFPLRVLVCESCWLVQTEDYSKAEDLFNENYAYFSSVSTSWLKHAEDYVLEMIGRFKLNSNSKVIEIACNDGYLLQFVKKNNIPCLGIEPTLSTAKEALNKGIDVIEDFFGENLALKLKGLSHQADLVVANNVLAHVPDINDFVAGIPIILKPNGVATFEFPHLLNLMKESQFDTIYHEHFSYLSLTFVKKIFNLYGLQIFNVEKIPTHGGSLRVFAQRGDYSFYQINKIVNEIIKEEEIFGLKNKDSYIAFQSKVNKIKDNFISFLIDAKNNHKKVIGYGAAAKASTLINFSGIREDLIEYVVDKSNFKINKFIPGSRIPIKSEDNINIDKPDFIIIFPWNIKNEIMNQLSYVRDWGGKFVLVTPNLIYL